MSWIAAAAVAITLKFLPRHHRVSQGHIGIASISFVIANQKILHAFLNLFLYLWTPCRSVPPRLCLNSAETAGNPPYFKDTTYFNTWISRAAAASASSL